MDRVTFALLNDFQREFPLVPWPFRILGEHCGASEREVLRILRDLQAAGAISRIGAVVARGRLGASTLGALAVPPRSLVLGIPAKVRRRLEENEDEVLARTARHYVDDAREFLQAYQRTT